jgi:hypothetical protein
MGYIQTVPQISKQRTVQIKLDMTSIPDTANRLGEQRHLLLLCLSRSLEIFVFSRNRLRCRVTRTVCSHQLRESNRLSQPFPYSSLTPYLYRYTSQSPLSIILSVFVSVHNRSISVSLYQSLYQSLYLPPKQFPNHFR